MAKNLKQNIMKGMEKLMQTTPEPQQEAAPTPALVPAGVRKSYGGNRAKIKEHTESVRNGLQDGYTRATIIAKIELVDKLKEIAYQNRSSFKETLELAMADYVSRYEKKNGKVNIVNQ